MLRFTHWRTSINCLLPLAGIALSGCGGGGTQQAQPVAQPQPAAGAQAAMPGMPGMPAGSAMAGMHGGGPHGAGMPGAPATPSAVAMPGAGHGASMAAAGYPTAAHGAAPATPAGAGAPVNDPAAAMAAYAGAGHAGGPVAGAPGAPAFPGAGHGGPGGAGGAMPPGGALPGVPVALAGAQANDPAAAMAGAGFPNPGALNGGGAPGGPEGSGAAGQSPQFPKGSAEYAVQKIVLSVVSGNLDGLDEVISEKSRGLLAELRDGTADPGKVDELKEQFAQVQLAGQPKNSGSSKTINLRNMTGDFFSFTVARDRNEEVYKVSTLTIRAGKNSRR